MCGLTKIQNKEFVLLAKQDSGQDSALNKVFGYFNCFDNSLFVELVTSLEEICENSKIKPEARLKAIGFIEGL